VTAAVEFINYYEILELPETADAEQIKKAIREQRRTWNKRAAQSDPVKRGQAELRVRHLAQAERVLLNPATRRQFDKERQEHRPARTAPRTDGSGTRDWLTLARDYFAQGNAHSANYAAREAITMNGAEHEAWAIRANASFLMRKYKDAEYEFNEAIRLQPDNAEYHFNFAEAYAAGGDWPSALDEYETALRLQPGQPMYKTAIANVYLQNDLPDRALELMEEVVEAHPKQAMFQYYLALALHEVTLSKWARLHNGDWMITSPEQIDVTRALSNRALSLKFDDPALRTSLQENLDLANKAATTRWFHANVGAWLVALVFGFCLTGAKVLLGIAVMAAVIGLYVVTHRKPVWKHNASLGILQKPGI
jgi:tetratricopeptide (TPR) repeat protein